MDEEMVMELVGKLNAALCRGFQGATDISVPDGEEDGRHVITCRFAENVTVLWELRDGFVQVRCDADRPGHTEDELKEAGDELKELVGKDAFVVAEEGRLTLQYLYSFRDADTGEKAARAVFYETLGFLRPVYENLPLLQDEGMDEIIIDASEEEGIEDFFDYDAMEVTGGASPEPFSDGPEGMPGEVPRGAEGPGEEPVEEFGESPAEGPGSAAEAFTERLDELMESLRADRYDPEGCVGSGVSEDEIDALLEESAMDGEYARTNGEIEASREALDEAVGTICRAMDRALTLNSLFFARERELDAKEKAFEARRASLKDEEERLKAEREEAAREREALDTAKATLAEIHSRDLEIERLNAALRADKDGEARRAYIKSLRMKIDYQDGYIKEITGKMDAYAKIVEELKAEAASGSFRQAAPVREPDPALEEKNRELAAECGRLASLNGELEKRVEGLKERLAMASAGDGVTGLDYETLMEEYRTASDDLDDALARLEAEKEEKETALERLEASKRRQASLEDELAVAREQMASGEVNIDPQAVIAGICAEAADVGINLQPVPSANGALAGGIANDCEVSYDVRSRVIYVRRGAKRNKAVQKAVASLNESDIRISCTLDNGGLIECKAFCIDTGAVVRMMVELTDAIGSF